MNLVTPHNHPRRRLGFCIFGSRNQARTNVSWAISSLSAWLPVITRAREKTAAWYRSTRAPNATALPARAAATRSSSLESSDLGAVGFLDAEPDIVTSTSLTVLC